MTDAVESPMPAEKALALVVRGTDWSETSRITTLFTREFGKVRALAKGGRRLKSNFDVSLDLLTVCQVVLIRKTSEGLDLLTEARMHERFSILREDLKSLYAGYYIAELLADGTQDYDPHPGLFDRALRTLRQLGKEADSRLLVTGFELAWLNELGYSPRLDLCAGCGAQLIEGVGRLTYSPASGGGLCPSCGPGAADRRWISWEAFARLRELATAVHDEHPISPEVPPGVFGEVRQILGQTVSCVLGKRPRLLGYVDAR
jgi:DNA repair protein RecO (recombination protein O)